MKRTSAPVEIRNSSNLKLLALDVRLAGVEEQQRAHRAEDVEVVLGVEEGELVAAEGAPLRVDGADRADGIAAHLGLAAQEVALVQGQDPGVPEGLDEGPLRAHAERHLAAYRQVEDRLEVRAVVADGSAERAHRRT